MNYQTYLYQKNYNIMHEMSLETSNDYDKYSYTIDELIKYQEQSDGYSLEIIVIPKIVAYCAHYTHLNNFNSTN